MSTFRIIALIFVIVVVGLAIGLGVYFGTQSSTSPSATPSVTISKPIVPVDVIESLYAFVVESPGSQSVFVNIDTQSVVSALAQTNFVKSSFVFRNILAVGFFDVPQAVQFFNLSSLNKVISAGQITVTGQRLIDMCLVNDSTIALLTISTDSSAVRSLQLYDTSNIASPVMLDSKTISSEGAYVRYLNSKFFVFSSQVKAPTVVVHLSNFKTMTVQANPLVLDPLAAPVSLIRAIFPVPGNSEILVVASVNDFVAPQDTTSVLYTVSIDSTSFGVVNTGTIANFRADQIAISPNKDLIFLAATDNSPGELQIYNVSTKASKSVPVEGISPQPVYAKNQLLVFHNTNGFLHMSSYLGTPSFTLESNVDLGVKLTGAAMVVVPFIQ